MTMASGSRSHSDMAAALAFEADLTLRFAKPSYVYGFAKLAMGAGGPIAGFAGHSHSHSLL